MDITHEQVKEIPEEDGMNEIRVPYMNRMLLSLLVVIAILLSACASGEGRHFVDQESVPDPRMRVAVLPFENLSDNPNAGVIVSQLLSSELYTRQVFYLMEESEMRRILAAKKVDIDRLSDSTVARQVAEMLGVDAVITGAVAEYAYQHGLREEPAVGLNMRMVRVSDGAVIWSASRSDLGAGFLQRDSLVHVAQRAVRRIVNIMMRSPGPQLEMEQANSEMAENSALDIEQPAQEANEPSQESEDLAIVESPDNQGMDQVDHDPNLREEVPLTEDLTMQEVEDESQMYQDNEFEEFSVDGVTMYQETPELLGDMAMLVGDIS